MKRIITFTALVEDTTTGELPDGRDMVHELEQGWALKVLDFGFERIDIEEGE